MKGLGKILTALLAIALTSTIALTAKAATLGTDNANQTAYDDGWATTDDGSASGDGFGAWTLGTGDSDGGTQDGFAGHFIGDPAGLGDGINVGGEAFGMYGTVDTFADAFRDFDSDLAVGQTFTIDIAVNFRNGNKGIDLVDSGNPVPFNFNIGSDAYTVSVQIGRASCRERV